MKFMWITSTILFLFQVLFTLIGLYFIHSESVINMTIEIFGATAFVLAVVGWMIFDADHAIKATLPFVSCISLMALCAIAAFIDIVELGGFKYLVVVVPIAIGYLLTMFIVSITNHMSRESYFKTLIISLPLGIGAIVGGLLLLFSKKSK